MTLEPDALTNSYNCGAPGNWNNWCSKPMEACLVEGRGEYDAQKRAAIYKKCLTITQEEAYMGSGYTMPGNLVYRKEVKGVEAQWGTPLFYPGGIWLDK
jgi:ABC-type transport system substrate-binding protein